MTSSKWQKLSYLNRYLLWIAVLALALLATRKDAELDRTVRKLDSVQAKQLQDYEQLEKRMDNIMHHIREFHR